jgi:hypothetical protein
MSIAVLRLNGFSRHSHRTVAPETIDPPPTVLKTKPMFAVVLAGIVTFPNTVVAV